MVAGEGEHYKKSSTNVKRLVPQIITRGLALLSPTQVCKAFDLDPAKVLKCYYFPL